MQEHTEEIWIDKETGYIWQKKIAPYEMNFLEAYEYPKELNKMKYGGYGTWELPTASELKSLIGDSVKNIYSSCGTLNMKKELADAMEVEIPIFWTMPILKGEDDLIATVVLFDAGVVYPADPTNRYHVMCVVK